MDLTSIKHMFTNLPMSHGLILILSATFGVEVQFSCTNSTGPASNDQEAYHNILGDEVHIVQKYVLGSSLVHVTATWSKLSRSQN